MILSDFLNKINRDISLTPDLRRKLFATIIPNGLGEILDFINLNEAVYSKTLSAESEVQLPLNFGYPQQVRIGETKYDRVDLNGLLNSTNKYGILLNNNNLDYTSPLIIANVRAMGLDPLRSRELLGSAYEVRDLSDNVLARMYDNEHIFYIQTVISDRRQIKINIVPTDDIARHRDGDILYIKTQEGVLEIILKAGVNEYFLAEDGSTYTEQALTTLITRAVPRKTGSYILKFNGATSGNLEVYYKISHDKYVNQNEDEPMIDDYYQALRFFVLKELYDGINKQRRSSQYELKYQGQIQLLLNKKGKITENRIERQVTPSANVYRSKVSR
jgi:hypothetical protein